jgi:hypothetical protein
MKDKIIETPLNLQEILDRNTLEYGFLPNYHKFRNWETEEDVVVFTTYKERLENLLKETERNGDILTPKVVQKDSCGREYPIVWPNDKKWRQEPIPEGYRVEISPISFGPGYWNYHLYTVYKNDKFLFDAVRNYSSSEFALISTPHGDYFIFSEDYESFTIIDIKRMKIYGHRTGICPWKEPTIYYEEDANKLEFYVEGVYWGCEGDPQLIELEIDVTKELEEDTWLKTMKIIDTNGDDEDYYDEDEDEEDDE